MKARFDTLFGRLFGVLFVAIVLAHLLAFAWFRLYGPPPPPPPPELSTNIDGQPPIHDPAYPPRQARPWFGGPVVPLTFQFITLMIAAWYGAKLLSRPIQRLSDAAERLSENLDSAPLDESGPREARQAAHTFNLMQRRIREQVQLDATLTYLHEQRTSEALQLLDVQALVESLCENAQDQGADVQVSGGCTPLPVQPMALRSCINNLLDNALRYAGQARIELLEQREELLIRVIDHGPGIAEDQREAVFEPFYRLEGSRNRNSGGVGLGMTIAREAAQRLGGRLDLEETPGGGLTAIVRLPRG